MNFRPFSGRPVDVRDGDPEPLDAGVDTIEHCSCYGENGMRTPPGLAEAIAAAGVVVCPTLGHDVSALDEQSRAMMEKVGFSIEQGLAQVGELYRRGVTSSVGATPASTR